jgi:hypothetical protein
VRNNFYCKFHRQFIEVKNRLYYLRDIKFWIILFFAIRLYGITNSPLEPASAWRQTDVLMIARNFYENSPNIFYPTVDINADAPSTVGCEFPILNYLIYLGSLVFGFEYWYGRLINLCITSLGLFFFYKIIRKYFGEPPAFNASIIFLVSMWFSYSRITIPDVFGASLNIIALYFSCAYLEKGKTWHLFLFFTLGMIGCLSKISAATILTPLAIPVFLGNVSIKRKLILCIFSLIILSVVGCWYFFWVPHLNAIGFSGHFFMGMPFTEGAIELLNDWPRTLAQFYDTPLKYTGFLAFIVAVILTIKNKAYPPLTVFLLTFCSFLAVVIKSGQWFFINGYYPLVVVPAMAFMTGYGLSFLKPKLITAILLIVSLEGIANQIHVFQIRQPDKSLENLEAILVKANCLPHDLIAINVDDMHNPIPMYFAHRKGGNVSNRNLSNPNYLVNLKNRNYKYIVVLKQSYGNDISIELPMVYNSEYFSIYSMK